MPDRSVPLISVALCTFNGERHLREQLDSVLAQDWPHIEIIVMDDASTDGTPAILAGYAERDARIHYRRNEHNLGYHRNFEAAITRCQGRWIAPCDQDDIWLPGKLSTLAAELAPGRAVMAYGDSDLMDEQGRPLGQRLSERMNRFSTEDPVAYWFANNVTGHAMLFERSLLEHALPFPANLFHDWWLAYVAASAGRIHYVNQCLVRYRQHARTVTDITGSRPNPAERKRGFRSRELADTCARLERLAEVPGKGQAMTRELLQLWRERESQFVSYRLAWFLFKHRRRAYAIAKDSPFKKARRPFQYVWGLRTKQLLEPHRYANTH
jgi:glycosyltransferase involved in cell wall biosynthesis